jgi:hypothetical protein
MKKNVRNLFLGMALTTVVLACGSDDNNDPKTPDGGEDLGTFAGNIMVVDDPQSQLGYILNAKVAVSHAGETATVRVTGSPGFEREYTGTYTVLMAGSYRIDITKQTKPVEKAAGDDLLIDGNKLGISIDLASDEIVVYDESVGDAKETIKGKIQMIGNDLLKE